MMFSAALHFSGGFCLGAIPFRSGPRHHGQSVAATVTGSVSGRLPSAAQPVSGLNPKQVAIANRNRFIVWLQSKWRTAGGRHDTRCEYAVIGIRFQVTVRVSFPNRTASVNLTQSPLGKPTMPFDPDARLAEWRKSLLDITKRNRLIKFAAGRIGGAYFAHPTTTELWESLVREGETLTFAWKHEILGLAPGLLDVETLAADHDPILGTATESGSDIERGFTDLCLKSPHLRKGHILTEFTDQQLVARLTRLFRLGREGMADHGVTTLFAAFGFLRWYDNQDSEEEVLSPLLLVPVRLDRETVQAAFTLRAEEDEVLPNHCLAELLKTQFRIKLPTATECPLELENADCLANYLKAVIEKIKHIPRWGVVESSAIGVFNFQKLAMWEDLGRNADRVQSHPICRAIAGDSAVSLKTSADLPLAKDLDQIVPAHSSNLILDADSSQQEAIEAVKRGAHLVMDGPPGTGKSQTIANMIAETLAAGKTVLFVSEKTAALEVVKRRLDRCGLGDYCLELHSAKANKKQVLAELGRCLEIPPVGVPDVATHLLERDETRKRLNELVRELHAIRSPLGWSAFRVHGELARVDKTPGRSRVIITDVLGKDAEYLRRGTEILSGLADARAVLEEPGGHPWRGCKITAYTHGVADEARYTLNSLANAIPSVGNVIQELASCGVCDRPFTIQSWRKGEHNGRAILALPLFPVEWFRGDARQAAEATISLNANTQTARELAKLLPEFNPVAMRRITNQHDINYVPDRERLHTPLSLRNRLAQLNHLTTTIRTIRELVVTVAKSAQDVANLLRLPPLSIGQSQEVATLSGRIAAMQPIPTSWCDVGRRAELVAAVRRARDDEREILATRARLMVRVSPISLALESAPLVQQAVAASGSSWSWLPWSDWSKIRKQLGSWYSSVPVDTSTRTDIAELAAYHQRVEAVRQVATAYAAELLLNSTGAPDWEATATGLQDVETLERWKPQHELKGLLAAGGSLARNELATSAKQLAQVMTTFTSSWSDFLRQCVVPDPERFLLQPTIEVQNWLDREAISIENETTVLKRLVDLLAIGSDVAATDIRNRCDTLGRLIEARSHILVASQLAGTMRTPEALEECDHTEDAKRAATLLGFLTEWARPLTSQLSTTLADPTGRGKLRTALELSTTTHAEFDRIWTRVVGELFPIDVLVSTSLILEDTPLDELTSWANARSHDTHRLSEWSQFVKSEKELLAFGIPTILDEINTGEFLAVNAVDVFRARFCRSWLDSLHKQVPALAEFTTESHERIVERFAALDRFAIHTTPDRVRLRLNTNSISPSNRDSAPDTSELGILVREVNKKRRQLPLRELFRQIPTILPRIKPCLMMSPLAVSTYLDTPELNFDVVIFDEASQVRPHDAMCAIYRGRQLVVGGDPKQLPPTDFFNRSSYEGDDSDDVSSGFESLLDVCVSLGLTRKRLRWHYRSRREGLIAFSNRYIYDGKLVTFPSADEATTPAVTFQKVLEGRFKDGVNLIEAKRVAILVLEHARTNSDRSLGVIAFSQRQQDRILDELEILRRESTETESFFADDRQDPFFVKNLENVQGDERDVILLSVGYGPDETGKVAMRFGPLNRLGGERRLNVAVTRARRSMIVVASMTAADVDLARTSAEGAKMLKAFLDYAERGPSALGKVQSEVSREVVDSPFEAEVAAELGRHGFPVHQQIGCGGYLIDIAILDPQQSGRYVLGVECDGATYHAAATARDRDRLRQEVLEGLGWRLIRVWSADWVRNKSKQVRRIMAALEASTFPDSKHRQEVSILTSTNVNTRSVPFDPVEYQLIESVPEGVVEAAVTQVLRDYGSMPVEALIAAVSKHLGFKRTGPLIRERISIAVNTQVSTGLLDIGDDLRVRLVKAK
ncbi:MAG: hypothetical protein C0467_25440 [Planctomycetaceae bacterium]|nr:hypothetical protein [Planctomycetaceae bacterium]